MFPFFAILVSSLMINRLKLWCDKSPFDIPPVTVRSGRQSVQRKAGVLRPLHLPSVWWGGWVAWSDWGLAKTTWPWARVSYTGTLSKAPWGRIHFSPSLCWPIGAQTSHHPFLFLHHVKIQAILVCKFLLKPSFFFCACNDESIPFFFLQNRVF